MGLARLQRMRRGRADRQRRQDKLRLASAASLDLGDPDASIGFRYNRATNGGGGVVLRFIDTSDYLRVRFLNFNTVNGKKAGKFICSGLIRLFGDDKSFGFLFIGFSNCRFAKVVKIFQEFGAVLCSYFSS